MDWQDIRRCYSVFFLFSSTKIGHGRPSVKNRYAISDKNILRSYVVRYFFLKFLACRSSMPLKMYKKKGKKCVSVQCGAYDISVISVLLLRKYLKVNQESASFYYSFL